jgi:hypothetical protein
MGLMSDTADCRVVLAPDDPWAPGHANFLGGGWPNCPPCMMMTFYSSTFSAKADQPLLLSFKHILSR